ncbi:MAG: ParB N-terminal domain-containing protein [Anaerolineae bacterium]|nr:ParB N-terminal domain-containing protein [Anaerolineae bacterium]
MFIDTIDQWNAHREQMQPVYIQAKRRKIVVPCANTIIVKRDLVQANTYNPNNVPDHKMKLLQESIIDNGFAFAIVTIYDPDLEKFVIVDGFHRDLISGEDWLGMSHVPIVVLDHDTAQRMIATIQFNKARGVHQVDLDAEVIRSLIEQGLSEDEIAAKLGVDLDTVYRYKQVTGIADLFKNADYSMSWNMHEVNEDAVRH